jgi:hypothetical protein
MQDFIQEFVEGNSALVLQIFLQIGFVMILKILRVIGVVTSRTLTVGSTVVKREKRMQSTASSLLARLIGRGCATETLSCLITHQSRIVHCISTNTLVLC